jgi:hypothetical protein
LESKKDKCVEILRNSSAIHDMLKKAAEDEFLREISDLNAIAQVLFSNQHFLNCKPFCLPSRSDELVNEAPLCKQNRKVPC